MGGEGGACCETGAPGACEGGPLPHVGEPHAELDGAETPLEALGIWFDGPIEAEETRSDCSGLVPTFMSPPMRRSPIAKPLPPSMSKNDKFTISDSS